MTDTTKQRRNINWGTQPLKSRYSLVLNPQISCILPSEHSQYVFYYQRISMNQQISMNLDSTGKRKGKIGTLDKFPLDGPNIYKPVCRRGPIEQQTSFFFQVGSG